MDLTDGIIEFGYEINDRTGLGVLFSPEQPHPFVKYVASRLKISPVDIMFDPGYDTPLSHGWCIAPEHINAVLNILNKNGIPYTLLGKVTVKVSGVCRHCGTEAISLPRYWDDKLADETSYEIWAKNILGRS